VSEFELYRYTHADGTAKEWAWCIHADGIEVRWGRASQLVQQAVYPVSRRAEIEERARAKERKGYRYLGRFGIDADGRPVAANTQTNRPSRSTPKPTMKPDVPPIDLSQVETGAEDYWF
jgi:hypothetical protein